MQWYAFNRGGYCCPLGDCGDYEAAEEVADDLMPNQWVFLYNSKDILELAEADNEIRKGTETT